MTDTEIVDLFARSAEAITGKKLSGLTPRDSITELGIDSIAIAEIAGRLEETLGIHITDDDLMAIRTVQDVIDVVSRLVAAKK